MAGFPSMGRIGPENRSAKLSRPICGDIEAARIVSLSTAGSAGGVTAGAGIAAIAGRIAGTGTGRASGVASIRALGAA
mgnify:CR=1 FL=1